MGWSHEATGCCRGATTDGSAHTRGRQDQPNDKDQWARVSADTVLTTGCNPWVLTIALRPSSRQSTTPAALGQWGVAGLLGPAGDCTPAIEAVNAPEAQWTGLVRRHGPVQPPGYTHRRPIDGASIACKLRWLKPKVLTPGALSRLGFLASSLLLLGAHGSIRAVGHFGLSEAA